MKFINIKKGNSENWEALIDFGEYSQTFYFKEELKEKEIMDLIIDLKNKEEKLIDEAKINSEIDNKIQNKIDSMTDEEINKFINT